MDKNTNQTKRQGSRTCPFCGIRFRLERTATGSWGQDQHLRLCSALKTMAREADEKERPMTDLNERDERHYWAHMLGLVDHCDCTDCFGCERFAYDMHVTCEADEA